MNSGAARGNYRVRGIHGGILSMKETSRRSRLILVAATLGLALILLAIPFVSWQYLNTVPPFVPRLPPGPSPNGYVEAERAAMALEATMPAASIIPPVPGGPPAPAPEARWLDGTPAEIRARLAVIRPVLESFGETTLWDADGPRS